MVPGLLILVGAIALAANTGVLAWGSLYRLLDLWPLVLVLIGVELVLRSVADHRVATGLGLAVLMLAVVGSVAYVSAAPPVALGGSFDTTGPVGGLQRASLSISSGASEITVGTQDLGDTLYNAHIVYSGARPEVSLDGSGELSIKARNENVLGFLFGPRGHDSIQLTLNSSLPWSVDVSGGASQVSLDLSSLSVSGVGISGGASQVRIDLGRPSGTVSIDVSGGASSVTLRRPPGVPVAVSVSGGATSVRLDGRAAGGIGSSELKSPDYDSASDRYSVDVSGGASSVVVSASG